MSDEYAATRKQVMRDVREAAVNYSKVVAERDRLRAVLEAIVDAVMDEGPRPDLHRAIAVRHRGEWPTLWRAIDRAAAVLNETEQAGG